MKRLKELALTIHHEVVDVRQFVAWSMIFGIYIYAIVAFWR